MVYGAEILSEESIPAVGKKRRKRKGVSKEAREAIGGSNAPEGKDPTDRLAISLFSVIVRERPEGLVDDRGQVGSPIQRSRSCHGVAGTATSGAPIMPGRHPAPPGKSSRATQLEDKTTVEQDHAAATAATATANATATAKRHVADAEAPVATGGCKPCSGTCLAAIPKPGLKRRRPETRGKILERKVRRCNDEDNNRVARLHFLWMRAIDYDGKAAAPDGADRSYNGPRVEAGKQTAHDTLAARVAWDFASLRATATYEQRLRVLGDPPWLCPNSKGK
jgi:hypothetical protein